MKPSILLLIALLSLAACREDPPPTAASSTPTPASARAHRGLRDAEARPVTLRLDDKVVAAYGREDLIEPRTLSGLLPESAKDPSTWKVLRASSKQGRQLVIRQFRERYKHHEVRLYLDEEGRPSVGVFRVIRPEMSERIKRELRKPHLTLVGATELTVRTTEVPPAKPADQMDLHVLQAKTDITVSAKQLDTLKRHKPFGSGRGGGRRKAGWTLADVLTLAKQTAPFGVVLQTADNAQEVTITATQLTDPEQQALLRHNRRGLLAFALYRKGEQSPAVKVRDVRRLTILSQPPAPPGKAPPPAGKTSNAAAASSTGTH